MWQASHHDVCAIPSICSQFFYKYRHLDYSRPGGRSSQRVSDFVRRRAWRHHGGNIDLHASSNGGAQHFRMSCCPCKWPCCSTELHAVQGGVGSFPTTSSRALLMDPVMFWKAQNHSPLRLRVIRQAPQEKNDVLCCMLQCSTIVEQGNRGVQLALLQPGLKQHSAAS